MFARQERDADPVIDGRHRTVGIDRVEALRFD